MLCQNCTKNEATIHIKEIVGAKSVGLHLCAECAALNQLDLKSTDGLELAAFVYNLAKKKLNSARHANDHEHILVCPLCGHSFGDYQKSKRLGCPECYEAFAAELAPLLARMHRGTRQPTSRDVEVPSGPSLPEEAAMELTQHELRHALADAVASEDYERAAALRDQLMGIGV